MKTQYTIQKTTRVTIITPETPLAGPKEDRTETTVQATIEAESSADAICIFEGQEPL